METRVTLFTQDGCADSRRVRSCFVASGVPFVERNVSRDERSALELAATGLFATPVVESEGRAILAANLPALAAALGFVCRCRDTHPRESPIPSR